MKHTFLPEIFKGCDREPYKSKWIAYLTHQMSSYLAARHAEDTPEIIVFGVAQGRLENHTQHNEEDEICIKLHDRICSTIDNQHKHKVNRFVLILFFFII